MLPIWSVDGLGTGTGVPAICNAHRIGIAEITIAEQDVLISKLGKQGYDIVIVSLSTVLMKAWPAIAKALAPKDDLTVSGILASRAWDAFEAASRGPAYPKRSARENGSQPKAVTWWIWPCEPCQ